MSKSSKPLPGTKLGVAVYPGKAAGRSLESLPDVAEMNVMAVLCKAHTDL